MPATLNYPHIEKQGTSPARLQRVPRVRVAQIAMDQLAHGWSAEEICRQHPYLKLSEVHSALAYYFDHQEEIDAEIRQEWEEVEKSRAQAKPSPFLVKLRAKGLIK